MKDQSKTKQALIQELDSLKQRIAELEQSESEHKRAEQELLLRNLIFEASITANSIADIEGILTHANSSFIRTWGYENKEEVIGKPISDFLKFEHETRKIITALNENNEWAGEYTALRRDGTTFNAYAQATIVIDESGNTIGYQSTVLDITERKRAEEALRESEERYRNILESIEEGYYEVDIAGNFTFFNDSMSELLGYSKDELKGMNNRRYTDEENAKILYRAFNKVYTTGKPMKEFDWAVIRKDGNRRFAEASVSLIRDSEDTPIGFRGIVRDITERKKAEEALKQSEERYRTVLEEIEDGYQEVDLSGNFTFFNESFRKIFGYSENELLGSNFRRYAADEAIADNVYRAYNQMYKTGNSLKRFEWDIITKDGARRSIEFSASLLRDGEGHRRGFRGIVRDVTDRKFVEEQYRTMANSAQTGVYIVQDGRLCFVNPHIPSYSGYPEAELIGEQVLHFVHPDDREMVREMARKMLAGELTTPYEYRMVNKNNQVRWLMETVTPISYKGRSAVLGNTMDTTEHKKAEEELQLTLERLRKAVGTTIQVMVSAVERRDPYTAGHQIRSANIARAIATEMGLPQEKIDGIRIAGSIHDIGKLSIPAEILSKPTKLTDLEYSLIKEHSRSGYEILKDVESPWPLAEIVYQHHERMDGSGYPRNLKGEEIIMEARIMAVADVVEAMASHRPYRPGLGIDAALEEIEKNRGTHYDNTVVDACLRLFREKGYQLEGA